jgi:hypothetical protein
MLFASLVALWVALGVATMLMGLLPSTPLSALVLHHPPGGYPGDPWQALIIGGGIGWVSHLP